MLVRPQEIIHEKLSRVEAKWFLHFIIVHGGKPNFSASVCLHIQKAKGGLLFRHVVVDKNFQDVLGTALGADGHKNEWATGSRWITTGREVHGTYCAQVPSVKLAGLETMECFRHVVDGQELVWISKNSEVILRV